MSKQPTQLQIIDSLTLMINAIKANPEPIPVSAWEEFRLSLLLVLGATCDYLGATYLDELINIAERAANEHCDYPEAYECESGRKDCVHNMARRFFLQCELENVKKQGESSERELHP